MTRCYIGLGGNLGDVVKAMEVGLERLDRAAGISVTGVSPVYQTAPVGPASETFLNAAAELACKITAHDLLRKLQSVENEGGRTRGTRWGARTLDLDILLFGDALLSEAWLTIPHPHLWYRRFVLDPLSDLAPAAVHPGFDKTVHQLRELLLRRPLPVLLSGDPHEQSALGESLQNRFPEITLTPEKDDLPEELLILDLAPLADASAADPQAPRGMGTSGSTRARRVRLRTLPGSLQDAAESVLAAALDCPTPSSLPPDSARV